jgi:cold shock CspA family protein
MEWGPFPRSKKDLLFPKHLNNNGNVIASSFWEILTMTKVFKFSSSAGRSFIFSYKAPVWRSFQLIRNFSNVPSTVSSTSTSKSVENPNYLPGEIVSFSVPKGVGFIKPLTKVSEEKGNKKEVQKDKKMDYKKEENVLFTKRELMNAGVHKTLWPYLAGVQVRYCVVNNRISSLLGSIGPQIQPLPPPKRTFPPDTIRYLGTVKYYGSKGYGAIAVSNVPADIMFYAEELYCYGSYFIQGKNITNFFFLLSFLFLSACLSFSLFRCSEF